MRISGNNNLAALIMLTLMVMPSVGHTASELEQLMQEIELLKKEVAAANEWRQPNTLIHMAGYADVGYVTSEAPGDNGSFNVGTFSPIFHYQYRDLVMLESELELKINDNGETETALEYLTVDWFVNDYMVLVAGKFLSPIGQFRQNLHPSWINKLPSAPPGFGHDGAAPVSDLGFQARGGFHIGEMKATYAVYMGNGPELKAEIEPDPGDSTIIDAIELDGVEAEAFGADSDGEKVIGGRVSILPVPELEIGLSLLTGQATVTEFEAGEFTGTEPSLAAEPTRDYDVTGADFSWRSTDYEARGEYVKTEVAEAASSNATDAAEWETWYLQLAYRLFNGDYEAVVRVGDFDSPHASADREQVSVGLNRLFSNNFIGKIAFESNDNPNAGLNADDRWLVQLSYGF
ncbi:MAG: hypothetical protein OQL09_05810 [Gammaproteobacteria bacterium]|nr:hypothetical protein [Gammaproteobacteria bacterium]